MLTKINHPDERLHFDDIVSGTPYKTDELLPEDKNLGFIPVGRDHRISIKVKR